MESLAERSPSRRARTPPRPPTDGWWGSGVAPHLRWPGVTLNIPATWSAERARWESHEGRFYFDSDAAARACDFFPTFLTHHKGEFAAQPFELLDFQKLLVVQPLFGWKRAADDLRRFRKVFMGVPKGNGKSPLGAGLALELLLCDGEEGAEVYSAAADRQQAGIVFDTAKVMVENSRDELKELCTVYRRAIEVPSSNSTYKVLSADAGTKHGFNIHGLIFDEFHAQPDRELYETLYRGMVKRRQPVLLMITTAGDDDESICYEEYEYARRVQSGTIDDETYLAVIFEAAPEDDWTKRETWEKVNPGFGITVKADAIESEARAAQSEPRKRNDFLRYHLNRWVNQATAWIPIEWWDECRGELHDEELKGLQIAAGLDMAQKIDLACLSLVFRHPLALGEPQTAEVVTKDEADQVVTRSISLNYRVSVVPFFWIPENTMKQREKEDGVPYRLWAEQGLVFPTEGDIIDHDRIFKDFTKVIVPRFPRLKGAQIGYDPAFATEIAMRIQGAGFQVVEILQNYKHLSEPSQVFEALVKAKRVTHDGHRVLRWNVENVAIRQDDAGRIRPVKPRRSTKRIDGVVATIMGLSRLVLIPVPPEPRVRVL